MITSLDLESIAGRASHFFLVFPLVHDSIYHQVAIGAVLGAFSVLTTFGASPLKLAARICTRPVTQHGLGFSAPSSRWT